MVNKVLIECKEQETDNMPHSFYTRRRSRGSYHALARRNPLFNPDQTASVEFHVIEARIHDRPEAVFKLQSTKSSLEVRTRSYSCQNVQQLLKKAGKICDTRPVMFYIPESSFVVKDNGEQRKLSDDVVQEMKRVNDLGERQVKLAKQVIVELERALATFPSNGPSPTTPQSAPRSGPLPSADCR